MRWFLPFTGTFIRNQIMYHKRYRPHLVYTQWEESTLARELQEKVDSFYAFSGSPLDRKLYERARILTPAAKKRIKNHIRAVNPDVLHVHYGVDCSVYGEIIRDLGIPACVSFYGYDCTSFPKRFMGYGKVLLQRRVFNNPSVKAVLAMTPDMKKDLLALGCPNEKIRVHYYGTETGPFNLPRKEKDDESVSFVMISGLHPKKGHANLIEAWHRLIQNTDAKVHLHIIGDGPLKDQLRQQIDRLGVRSITLHGPVKYGSGKHMQFLRNADVFVHPSIQASDGDKEGIPGAIIEAMAAGLPVVSTYHAGIPYILDHEKTGLLVPEGQVAALSDAMQRLALDAGLRESLGRQAREFATRDLDVREKEKELEEIYDALAK